MGREAPWRCVAEGMLVEVLYCSALVEQDNVSAPPAYEYLDLVGGKPPLAIYLTLLKVKYSIAAYWAP